MGPRGPWAIPPVGTEVCKQARAGTGGEKLAPVVGAREGVGGLPAVRLNSSKEGRASGKDGEGRPDWASLRLGTSLLWAYFFSYQP